MELLMPTMGTMQNLAKRFSAKLSRCQVYDANVCTTRSTPDKPWELIVVSGEPFFRRLRFIYKKRMVSLLANNTYVSGTVAGTFANRPVAVNARQEIGLRSDYAKTICVGADHYPIFTEDGQLSPDQEDLLNRSQVVSLLEQTGLREGESLHFTRGEIAFYLKQPTSERVSNAIERMIDIAGMLEIAEEPLNLKLLPVKFHPIIPLIEKWGVADDSDRDDLLNRAPQSALQMLTDEVGPYLEVIDSYLDSFQEGPPTEQAAALARLAECALEAKTRLGDKNGLTR
jgi:hypothetical protein